MSTLKVSLSGTAAHSYDNRTEAVVFSGDPLVLELHCQAPWSAGEPVTCNMMSDGFVVGVYSGTGNIQIPAEDLTSGQYELFFNQKGSSASGYTATITKVLGSLSDDDMVLTLDRNKRILNTELHMLGVQNDTNSEVLDFRFPRYADGIDLSTKLITIHYITDDQFASVSNAVNVTIDDEYVFFSWVISRGVTHSVGDVHFAVHCIELDDQGVTTYQWATQPAVLPVKATVRSRNRVYEQNPEALDQWLDIMHQAASAPDGWILSVENGGKLKWVSAPSGPVGGHYTPKIEQTSVNKATVSYTGSKPDMPKLPESQLTLPIGPKGDDGKIGPVGHIGPTGPRGKDGKTFDILGLYPTLEALKSAHATGKPGDAYAVGTAQKNSVYIWDVDRNAWTDIGPIEAPASVANDFANAFKNAVSGEIIAVDDVSPVVHNVGCKVSSKNLLASTAKSESMGGVAFTVHTDKSVTVNGTATENVFYCLQKGFVCEKLVPYVISGCPDDGGFHKWVIYDDKADGMWNDDGATREHAVKTWEDEHKADIYIRIRSGAVVNNLTFYPKIEEGTKPTPYTPYVPDLTAVNVERLQNVIDYDSLIKPGYKFESYGVTYTVLKNLEVKVQGTATRDTSLYMGTLSNTAGEKTTVRGAANMAKNGVQILWNAVGFVTTADLSTTAEVKRQSLLVYMEAGASADTIVYPVAYRDKYQKYTPLPDGTVPGMTSLSPDMTILSDTPGVLIDAEYNLDAKKYVDRKFAELQTAILGGMTNV